MSIALTRTFGPLAGPIPTSYLDDNFTLLSKLVVSSIAELRTLTKTSGAGAFVLGYNTVADGGGGEYAYDASDTTSADNGATIIVANDGGRWKLTTLLSLSVRLFGAKVDGVTDDATAVQNGINFLKSVGSGELVFPGGKCLIGSRLKIQQTTTNNNFIKLRGAGEGNAFVSPTGGTQIIGQTGGILFDCAGGSNITFEDLALSAGPTNASVIGILFQRIAGDQFCQRNQFVRVSIAMGTNPAANGGLGTYAVVNRRGEHHKWIDCWFYADNPMLCLGDSSFPTLISPDFAESGAASLSLNYFDNCAFLPATGHAVEWRSGYEMHIGGGYFQIANGKYGLYTSAFLSRISIENTNAELGPGGGTPKALVGCATALFDLTVKATTQLAALDMIRTVGGGTSIRGFDISAGGTFGAIFNPVTEAGGPMLGGILRYNSINGHTVPNIAFGTIYNSILIDAGAGAVASLDIRSAPSGQNTSNYNTGQLQPPTATTGTDTAPVVTETYFAEVFIPQTTLLSGVNLLQGSAAAGNFKVGLYDQAGNLVAQSASTSTSAVTAGYVSTSFTAAYQAVGPARYYIAVQYNNAANRYRSHALGNFPAMKQTATVFGTLPNPIGVALTGFTANIGPIGNTF